MKCYRKQVALHFSKISDWSYLKLTSILLSVANCCVYVATQLAVFFWQEYKEEEMCGFLFIR
jgi:hypothetical protein